MTMSCRISAAPRTRSAAPTIFTAAGGPLDISDLRAPHELHDAFIAGAQEAGFPANPDFNGAEQEGVGNYQLDRARDAPVQRGDRLSAPGDEAPQPDGRDPRLRPSGIVRRQARGRPRISRRTARSAGSRARREVLLAGGSLLSPQLLQLSGVGPGELLREHGIEVVHELPGVGDNLQDHLQARVIFAARSPSRPTTS